MRQCEHTVCLTQVTLEMKQKKIDFKNMKST